MKAFILIISMMLVVTIQSSANSIFMAHLEKNYSLIEIRNEHFSVEEHVNKSKRSCNKEDTRTNEIYFRASQAASSLNYNHSWEMAHYKAQEQLFGLMEGEMNDVLEEYIYNYPTACSPELRALIEEKIRQAIIVSIGKAVQACENVSMKKKRTPGGRRQVHTVFMVLEIGIMKLLLEVDYLLRSDDRFDQIYDQALFFETFKNVHSGLIKTSIWSSR